MRTTIDLPDDLYRQVKARAALRGMKLKEYVAAALRDSLFERRRPAEVREPRAAYGVDVSKLGEDCVLPLIKGETTELMRSISERKIDEILETDGPQSALPSGRR